MRIRSEAYNTSGGVIATQTVTLADNTISNNYGDGVYAYNGATDGGHALQTLTLAGNTIKYNSDDGLEVYNYAGGDPDSTAVQIVSLASGGNTISEYAIGIAEDTQLIIKLDGTVVP